MSSMPLISHRLFVAAIGNQARAAEPLTPRRASGATEDCRTEPIPLEVLAAARPNAPLPGRPLRTGSHQPRI